MEQAQAICQGPRRGCFIFAYPNNQDHRREADYRRVDVGQCRSRRDFRAHYSGYYTKTPIPTKILSDGNWFVVADLGGYARRISLNVTF